MRKLSVGVLIAALVVVAWATPVVSNGWLIVTGRGFFIPAESSLFGFRVTQMNDGSGEWWLYGQDKRSLFALHPSKPIYVWAERKAQAGCAAFRALDFTTWCSLVERPLPPR